MNVNDHNKRTCSECGSEFAPSWRHFDSEFCSQRCEYEFNAAARASKPRRVALGGDFSIYKQDCARDITAKSSKRTRNPLVKTEAGTAGRYAARSDSGTQHD